MKKFFFLGLLFHLSCQETVPVEEELDFLKIPSFTQKIVENMAARSASVEKSFSLNGKSETRTISQTDSTFWVSELELLGKLDLQAPKYQGSLQLTADLSDSDSNLKYDRLINNNSSLELREIAVYYLDKNDQVRKIKVNYSSNNFIAKSSHQVTMWFNEYNSQLLVDSMITTGQEKVLFQEERQYEIKSKRIPE